MVTINRLDPPAVVAPAENTEAQIVDRARAAVDLSNWTVGECAAEWTAKYCRGRTDADFASLIGCGVNTVQQCRRVFEEFSPHRNSYPGLKFSHFRAAISWDDAEACLQWAVDNEATYKEMAAWRRMQHGEDLTVDPEPDHEPELVSALPPVTEHDPAETERAERVSEPSPPFRDSALTPEPSLSDQTVADRVKKSKRLMRAIANRVSELQAIAGLDRRFDSVVAEHLDRLLDEFKRGDEIGGLDERTIDGMLR